MLQHESSEYLWKQPAGNNNSTKWKYDQKYNNNSLITTTRFNRRNMALGWLNNNLSFFMASQ